MKYKILELENKIKNSLKELDYEVENVTLNPSNRPDLGDYQYNGINIYVIIRKVLTTIFAYNKLFANS